MVRGGCEVLNVNVVRGGGQGLARKGREANWETRSRSLSPYSI